MRNKELTLWPGKLDFRDSMQNNQKITCPFELESWFKFKRKYKYVEGIEIKIVQHPHAIASIFLRIIFTF